MDKLLPRNHPLEGGDLVRLRNPGAPLHKYWEHKFSGLCLCRSDGTRRRLRLGHEGHPLAKPTRDDEDVHIFVTGNFDCHPQRPPMISSSRSRRHLISSGAGRIRFLRILIRSWSSGRTPGAALARLKAISSRLQELGYHTYIIKEQPDRTGESVIQKGTAVRAFIEVRHHRKHRRLWHLYEILTLLRPPSVSPPFFREGKGATWMFEDAYGKHRHWRKSRTRGRGSTWWWINAVKWAEHFVRDHGKYQRTVLPWLRKEVGCMALTIPSRRRGLPNKALNATVGRDGRPRG